MSAQSHHPAIVENAQAGGRVILVCEHASNAFPQPWGALGLSQAEQGYHIAWDPGALGLARALTEALDATLIHAPVSRLVQDCNRAPDKRGAMAARSEIYDIPGNADLSNADRVARTAAIYVPFHATVASVIADRIAWGARPVIITIHSFTPVWFGARREVAFGVIHDASPVLAQLILAEAQATTSLNTQLNAPYSAADDVTHTLRLHATPYGLPNAMLEIRNDLIATPQSERDMAGILAPVLANAISRLSPEIMTG